MTFGSLFAGIGGFDLGFERAGMKCQWQVEIDDYANKVLAKHWPNVRRHGDVRTFPPEPATDWTVDIICGGFPCQDISVASHTKTGLDGERSGLWREFARIIGVLQPGYVVVENVAALFDRGMGRVLADLFDLGFDAEWSIVPACSMGAPHTRARVFIVAYPESKRGKKGMGRIRSQGLLVSESNRRESQVAWQLSVAAALRISDRSASRMDRIRLRGLGNAVVPQIAEWIGKRIIESETPCES